MAFAEGRKSGCSDFGDVDLLLKTSKDNGLYWSEAKVIAEFDSLQAGNPVSVRDRFDPNYPVKYDFALFGLGIYEKFNAKDFII